MDVHPPHGALHSWKDFWIHLGTISIGLLIAISLEQSVEWVHHLHQRHQLEKDFREEAAKNKDLIDQDTGYLKGSVAQTDAQRKIAEQAKAVDGVVTFTLPDMPEPGFYVAPSRVVWVTAREGAMIDLLPAQEARMFSRVDYEAQYYEGTFAKFTDVRLRLSTLSREFSIDGEDGSSVWKMPAAQRDAFVELTAEYAALDEAVAHRLRLLKWADEEILGGAHDLDEMMRGINRRVAEAQRKK